MQWDLGLQGLGILVAMSAGFGVIAQLFAGRGRTYWIGLIGALAFFVGGLLASEVWFGWATEAELQPNIDGLSFDEVLLVGLLSGVAAVAATRWLAKRDQHRGRLTT